MKMIFNILILAIFPFACSNFASASGKFTFQNNLMADGKEYRPAFGLSVYEPMGKHFAVNMWTGYGRQFLVVRDDVSWWVSKAQLDVKYKRLVVSPGAQFKILPSEDYDKDYMVFVRVDYILW